MALVYAIIAIEYEDDQVTLEGICDSIEDGVEESLKVSLKVVEARAAE